MTMTLDEVAALALALPRTAEGTSRGWRTWTVGGSLFVWERPFSKADLRRLAGAPVPDGPVLAARTDDLIEKEAVLAAGAEGVFTIAHFDGYAAVLVDLSVAERSVVAELIVDGWLATAPAPLAAEWLATHGHT